VLYSQLAVHGVRDGAHWAWKSVACSAGVGFASFFLFLGFGYFDPLHAGVSIVLFSLFLLGLRGRPAGLGTIRPTLHNDGRWRLGLYGQLMFVMLGVGLIGAGMSIALIGVTGVLVPEDIAFLRSPAAAFAAANSRLLPLVAHDRAGFGGALVSDGLGVLLCSLWGFRAGARWLWWTLLGAGLPGYVAALGVHVAVGYLDLGHLGPAVVGLSLFAIALALSYPYLCTASGAARRAPPSAAWMFGVDAARPPAWWRPGGDRRGAGAAHCDTSSTSRLANAHSSCAAARLPGDRSVP
jgi:hypothetical protein